MRVRPRLPSQAQSIPSYGHQYDNSRHESDI
jgi:hypothetical protein